MCQGMENKAKKYAARSKLVRMDGWARGRADGCYQGRK